MENAEALSLQTTLEQIEISLLKVSKQNVRIELDEVNGNNESTIDDLANSIKSNGLLNPLCVKRVKDGHYEVFAGQRRLKAVQSLGWTRVACNIYPESMSENDAKIKSLVENFQRQDNSFKDKVEAFSTLLDGHCSGNVSELCRIVGTTEATAKKYIKLKVLPNEVLELLDKNAEGNRLYVQTATQLTSLPLYQQSSVAKMLVGKSTVEARAVIEHVTNNPTISEPARIEAMVKNAMDNHSLNVAIEAKLIAENSWRSKHPWIRDPNNPNEVYRITKVDEAFAVLLGMNALLRIPNGGIDTIQTKKRKLDPEPVAADNNDNNIYSNNRKLTNTTTNEHEEIIVIDDD